MVVAVNARAKPVRRDLPPVAEAAGDRRLQAEQPVGLSGGRGAERAAGGGEPRQSCPGFGVGRIDPGFEVALFDRFGGKSRIVRGNCEGAMQFGRAPAEQFADIEREAEAVARQLLVRLVGADGHLVEIPLERVDDGTPGISLVRNEFEGGGKRRFAGSSGTVVDGAEILRRVGEFRRLGQETGDLDIRLLAFAEPAVELEDDLVAEDDRHVRLLDAERARLAEILDRLQFSLPWQCTSPTSPEMRLSARIASRRALEKLSSKAPSTSAPRREVRRILASV